MISAHSAKVTGGNIGVRARRSGFAFAVARGKLDI
jgi:hypothetical protein